MSSLRRVVPAACAVILIGAASVRAITLPEAVISLARTGQTTCFTEAGAPLACPDTGQDGELQAGVAAPTPRFQDNGDGTLSDRLTGLMWLKDAGCVTGVGGQTFVPWAQALDGIATLNADPDAFDCADYTATWGDWRLPNVIEMSSLLNWDAAVANGGAWLASQGFVRLNEGQPLYWTSTGAKYIGDGAYAVYLVDRVVSAWPRTWNRYFLPVRGGSQGAADPAVPANLRRTGQTTSVYAGDDGALEAGVAWPASRLRNNGDGTVTDLLTGLMWTRNAKTPGPAACTPNVFKTWQQALTYVACLNVNAYLGWADWRLPTPRELESLADFEQQYVLLPAGHPFQNVTTDGVATERWTSTSWGGDPSAAYDVDFREGTIGISTKDNTYPVWPVRSMRHGLQRVLEGYTEGRCAEQYVTPDWMPGDGTVGATVGAQVCAEGSGTAPFTEAARAVATGLLPFSVGTARTIYVRLAINGVLGGDGLHESRIDVAASVRRYGDGDPVTLESFSVNAAKSTTGILPVNRDERFEFVAEPDVEYALAFEQSLSATATGAGSVASADFLGTTDALVSEITFPPTTSTTTLPTTTTAPASTTTSTTGVPPPTTSSTVVTTTSLAGTTTSTTLALPCGPAPDPACAAPVGSKGGSLVLKDSAKPTRDAITWSWRKGATTSAADLGTPTDVSDYVLCLWTDTAASPRLTLELTAPRGRPHWKPTRTGFVYKDGHRAPDGVLKLVLKAGDEGKATMTLAGKGPNLRLPPPPLALPVVVQLHRVDGSGCWSTTFTRATRNVAGTFKAVAD